MSTSKISIATPAPVPDAPTAPQGPSLPPAPPHLAQGATGLGRLSGASLVVSTLRSATSWPASSPSGVAVALTLLGLVIRWP